MKLRELYLEELRRFIKTGEPGRRGVKLIIEYTDNDMYDAESGMNLVDKATATRLVNNSVSALIADVIEHYKRCPLDDGNPAYRVFQNWLAEQLDGKVLSAS